MPLEMQAYNLYQVAEMLGMTKNDMQCIIDRGFEGFPFSVIKTGMKDGPRMYIVPKHQVDTWLSKGSVPQPKVGRNTPNKKYPKAEYTRYNLPISRMVDAKLMKVWKGINKELSAPVDKYDLVRLAIEEFIERRPEYLGGD